MYGSRTLYALRASRQIRILPQPGGGIDRKNFAEIGRCCPTFWVDRDTTIAYQTNPLARNNLM